MRNIIIIAAIVVLASTGSAQTSPWEPMNRGLGHTLIYNLAIDPVDSLRMFCGTDAGQVYESVDGGFNWQPRSTGLPPSTSGWRVTGLSLDPDDRNLLHAGYSDGPAGKRLFKSSDGGNSWTQIPTPDNWSVLHILRANQAIPRLFCGLGSQQGLHWTSNNGVSWTASINQRGVQTVAMHPQRPAVMLTGCSGNAWLLRSIDGGLTWQQCPMPFSGSNKTGVRSITFSPSSPDVVYIGVTGTGAGLYRSIDAGLNWEQLNQIGEISEIAVHPRNEDIIYISAIHTGVRRSTDRGRTWTTINVGLPTTDVMRVRIAPGYPVCVFAVTLKHGAFRMVDEELKEELFAR